MGALRNTSIVVALLIARTAHADTDIEKADKLFAEGLALRDSNLQQSCDRFAQSLHYNPQAIGTLLNVALCDEKLGRIASAVDHYSEARDRAKEGNLPDYLKEAQSHIDTLTPDLPYVQFTFAEKLAGMKVLIGDRVIPDEKLAQKVAVDPGELVIVVSAPGRLAYETKLVIAKKEDKPVAVPALKKGVTVKSSKRTIGIVSTITGGAMFLGGVALGLYANRLYDEPFDDGDCDRATKVCNADGQQKTNDARTYGTVGTWIGAIGLVGAGVGVFLWIRSPKESTERRGVSVIPQISPESAGFAAVGRF